MHPILFKLGNLEVPTYGLFMALAMLTGAWVFAWLASRLGAHRGASFEVALETMLIALVSSKVVGIAFQPAAGDMPFWQLVMRTGGVWYVGFLTGVAWAAWRLRHLGLIARQGLDCAAAAVASGHAIGRIGCFLAGCCWGGSCDRPWAVTFTSERAHLLSGVPLGVPLHPVQLYEAGAEALTAILLVTIITRRMYKFHLEPGLVYLLVYGFVRFGLEYLRDDPRGEMGLFSPSQRIALAIVAVAMPLYVLGAVRGTVIPWKPRVPGGDAAQPSGRVRGAKA